MIRLWWSFAGFVAVLIASMVLTPRALADGSSPDLLPTISSMIEQSSAAQSHLAAGNTAAARDDGESIAISWERVESLVAQRDPGAEEEIDQAVDQVVEALAANPPATDAATRLNQLRGLLVDLREQLEANPSAPQAKTDQIGIGEGIRLLQATEVALDRGDVTAARESFARFQQSWPMIEGRIAAESPTTYHQIEALMTRAATALDSSPADTTQARQLTTQMSAAMQSLLGQEQHYGPFDAAITLLREGLEALLIIGALLALVTRSGRRDLRWQVWAGAGVGVLASVAVAVLLQVVLSRLAIGLNRELLEGVTGLGAAAMLLYVSYWLHQQGSLADWRKFLASRTGAAIASGNLLILPSLAFLAVFREGAETIVLYAGMAASISLGDLILGMGLGLIGLAILGIALFGFGIRLSIKPFFRVMSVLLYYLAFKFVGTGIHALQVAGTLPTTSADYLPSLSIVGIFPTWQTTVAQAVLLAGAVLAVAWIAANQGSRRLAPGAD